MAAANTTTGTTTTTDTGVPKTITIMSDYLPRGLYSHAASRPNYYGEDFIVLDACTEDEDENKNLAGESRNIAEEEKMQEEQKLKDELEVLGLTRDDNFASWLPDDDELDSFFAEDFKDSTVEECGTESPSPDSMLPLETATYPSRPFQSVVASVLRRAASSVHEPPPSESERRPSKKFKSSSNVDEELYSVPKPLHSTPSAYQRRTGASNDLSGYKSAHVTSPCRTIEFFVSKIPLKAVSGTSASAVPVRSSAAGRRQFDAGLDSGYLSPTTTAAASASSSSTNSSTSSSSSTGSGESTLTGRSERSLDVSASIPARESLESSRTSSNDLDNTSCSVLNKTLGARGDVMTIGPDRDMFKSFCVTYGLEGGCQAAKSNLLDEDGVGGKVGASTHDQPPSTGFLVTVNVPPPATDGESTTDSEEWPSPPAQRRHGDNLTDLKLMKTDDERYSAVRKLWKNASIPDLNRNLSCQNYRRRKRYSNEPDLRGDGRSSSKTRKRPLGDRLGPKPAKRARVEGAATESYSCSRVFDFRRSSLRMTYDIEKKTLMVEYDNMIHSMSLRHRDEFNKNGQRMAAGRHCDDWGALRYHHEMEIANADQDFAQRLRNLDAKYENDVRKLMESRDEILTIQSFYCGLGDGGNAAAAGFDVVDLLDDNQIRDIEETETMYRFYDTCYTGVKYRPCATAATADAN